MKSTLTVVVGDLFSSLEAIFRQREAKAAKRLDYVVCVAPDAVRIYFFGKAQGDLKRWNGKALWAHPRTHAAVAVQLQAMGWMGDVPALPLTATNPKGST